MLSCTAGFSRRVTFFLFSFKPKRVVGVDLFGEVPERSRTLKLVNFSFKPKKGSGRGPFWGDAGTPFHLKPERINHLLVVRRPPFIKNPETPYRPVPSQFNHCRLVYVGRKAKCSSRGERLQRISALDSVSNIFTDL